ncbi:MAG: hypothetical protein CM15mP3_05070 [Candidatus Poseidoniales archaeon]|nr:MAG: hypothetical protein CM15mP3_05070 [Candidatus Poseidoniales archaeon]
MFWRRPARVINKYSDIDEKRRNIKEKFKQALISTVKAIFQMILIIKMMKTKIIVQKL